MKIMESHNPIVSIGLPVYNGEKYLSITIQSFLAQSFDSFELIISDNASSDHTEEICLKYAALDSRIRYFRNKANVGVARNHNQVFELSIGRYFKWAGHDDLYAPDYLRKCVNVLDSESEVGLCYPKTILIDEFSHETEKYEDDFDLCSPYPHERLHKLLRHPMNKLLNESLGLTRTSHLAKTGLQGDYYAADRVVLEELALQGQFRKIPEYLFYRRIHQEQSSHVNPSNEAKAIGRDPTMKGWIQTPRWKRFLGNLNGIRRAYLDPRERFLCYKEFWSFYLNPHRLEGVKMDII